MDPLWYKDAVIYQVHVRTFCDSNGDGIGDFRGLTSRLDYVRRLGVNAIWLLPFYESPLKDDGYDIAHYERIDARYGTMDDFRCCLAEAHRLGLQVFTELVINHTSDQHPWFQASRLAPEGSPKRDYYVWSVTPDRYRDARVIFNDVEPSNWTWDPIAKAYYWHRFFSHQPDLNFDNPKVRRAVLKVMRFWLDKGVDGLRLDAVAHLYEREGTSCENLPETHAFLREIRTEMDRRYTHRVLLAEADQAPAVTCEYFGQGDECHMAFQFPLMPRLFLALKREDASPIVSIVRSTGEIPPTAQWALFLRNHDELTISALTDDERRLMFALYAPEPRMRLNLGIRRRLAPLLDNDPARIMLAFSLLLSLPGSPVIYYGDELAMGDNVGLNDRDGVRTPMQWTAGLNAGFSETVGPLTQPVIDDAVFGGAEVNVDAQESDQQSMLWRLRRLIAARAQSQVFGRGTIEFLTVGGGEVLAFLRRYQRETVLVVANLSLQPRTCEVRLPTELAGASLRPLVAGGEAGTLTLDGDVVTLAPSEFRWLRVSQ
ncbi:MAG: maltose alpha-D-glucosyltransferase [Vicinamibacterales bacterium]